MSGLALTIWYNFTSLFGCTVAAMPSSSPTETREAVAQPVIGEGLVGLLLAVHWWSGSAGTDVHESRDGPEHVASANQGFCSKLPPGSGATGFSIEMVPATVGWLAGLGVSILYMTVKTRTPVNNAAPMVIGELVAGDESVIFLGLLFGILWSHPSLVNYLLCMYVMVKEWRGEVKGGQLCWRTIGRRQTG